MITVAQLRKRALKAKKANFSVMGKVLLVVILCVVFKKAVLRIKDLVFQMFEPKQVRMKRDYLEEVENSIDWNNVSYQPERLGNMAAQLYDCFEHSGTDSIKRIIAILSQCNTNDLKAIFVLYDIKTTHTFFFDDSTGTLYDHYLSELDDSELKELREFYAEQSEGQITF